MDVDKPIVIDLCCRKGGATVGYQRAGFYVIGVDIESQQGYPGDNFYKADALDFLRNIYGVRGATLIHAGPPCQDGVTTTAGNRARGLKDNHVQIIPELRELLLSTGIPYVIEQPTRSRSDLIRRDLTLCMDMFKGDMPPPWVQHHRSYELGNWPEKPQQPLHPRHQGYVRGHRHGVVRSGPEAPYVAAYGAGGGKATVAEMRHAKQIDWMTNHFDLREANPPAYSRWIGTCFLNLLTGSADHTYTEREMMGAP